MDVIKVAEQIEIKISQIDKIRSVISERGKLKAKCLSNYDKAIAITILKLKNGVEMELEGEKIVNPPTTIIEKISKGICWQEKLNMEEADISYKSAITNLDAVQSQLNALQSINKYIQ